MIVHKFINQIKRFTGVSPKPRELVRWTTNRTQCMIGTPVPYGRPRALVDRASQRSRPSNRIGFQSTNQMLITTLPSEKPINTFEAPIYRVSVSFHSDE